MVNKHGVAHTVTADDGSAFDDMAAPGQMASFTAPTKPGSYPCTLAAVLLYRYVDVPALGPIPAMDEPVWFAKKTARAVAEAVATLGGASGLLSVRTRPVADSRHR